MKAKILMIFGFAFTVFCGYLFILIPATGLILTPILGRDSTEDITISLLYFKKISVSHLVEQKTDIFYYLLKALPIVSFLIPCIAFFRLKINLASTLKTFLCIVVFFTLGVFASSDWLGGVVLGLVALSGIITASFWRCLSKVVSGADLTNDTKPKDV